MRTSLLLITILLISIVAIAQVKKPSTKTAVTAKTGINSKKAKKTTSNHGTFTDNRDGYQYKWVRIGKQVWMAENLCYTESSSYTSDLTSKYTPYSYIYDNDDWDSDDNKILQKYGVLYNWPAAKLACPQGWHLPTNAEWQELIEFLGGKEVAGGKMRMAGTTYWMSSNELVTNSSGFSALPGGYRGNFDGTFHCLGVQGNWWSSTERDASHAWYLCMYHGWNSANMYDCGGKDIGYSVRCVRD